MKIATNLHTLSIIYAKAVRLADPECRRSRDNELVLQSIRRRIHNTFLRLAAKEGHEIEGSPYRARKAA